MAELAPLARGRAAMARRWDALSPAARTWLRRGAIAVAALLLLFVLVVALFPVGLLRGTAERRLSERFGRPVTIGAVERETFLSFRPVIAVRDVRVPQADWAGDGDFARVDRLLIRIPVLPMLAGRFGPAHITARGVRLNLARAADGRTNWDKPDPDEDASGGDAPRLDGIDVRDTVVTYRDARLNRAFRIAVVANDAGVNLSGTGQVDGTDVRIGGRGGAVTDAETPWPFRIAIRGPALTMVAAGAMRAPLDTDHMSLTMRARADNLERIDAVIEAGLFGTQDVNLGARVSHNGTDWVIRGLSGTVGASDITGNVTVTKPGGRTRVEGDVRFGRLDLDDLASDAAQARSRARERRDGPRIVPSLRVDLSKIGDTDGRIAFAAERVVSRRNPPSTIRSLSGTLVLDRARLTVDPLRVGLARGAITGRIVSDQRGGASLPTVSLALDLRGSSVAAIAGGADVSGRVDARVRLTGRGETIRDAVGRSRGTIGVVASDGALPARLAELMGFDAGAALTTGSDARARLRCAVARLEVADGRGTFAPLVIDTSASQSRATGSVTFPGETIAASVTGAPKGGATLRIPGSVRLAGTLSNPRVDVPSGTRSVGNILRGIGDAITGNGGPSASDANCGALRSRALGD